MTTGTDDSPAFGRLAVRGTRSLRHIAMLLALACLPGCPPVDTNNVRPENLPTVREAAEQYNANLARLERLWARGAMELTWTDPKGDKRFEQGDLNLIADLPDRLALSVHKLGIDILWAGGDEQRYWLLWLQGNDTAAYVGRHENAGRVAQAERLPLPVRPVELPRLLGIVPIDIANPDDPAWGKRVKFVEGDFQFTPPGSRLRFRLDAKRFVPTHIDMLDDAGQPAVSSYLRDHELVELQGVPQGGWPRVASRMTVTMPGRDARMLMSISDMTDDPEKINDRVFDFDFLVRVKKPGKVVDLDAQ